MSGFQSKISKLVKLDWQVDECTNGTLTIDNEDSESFVCGHVSEFVLCLKPGTTVIR